MDITEVTIHIPTGPTNPRFLAYATIVLGGEVAIHGLRVIRRDDGRALVVMPSRHRHESCPGCGGKVEHGMRFCPSCGAARPADEGRPTHYDVAHPIHESARTAVESAVLAAYEAACEAACEREAGAASAGPGGGA